MREYGNALREHLFRAELIIYGALLVVGIAQIVIRERFPEVRPPWPLIGSALILILLGVLFVPPMILVVRMRKRGGSEDVSS